MGDYYIDCERMPSAEELQGHESEVIDAWLKKVDLIREQQTKLFDYLLENHPTEFTWLASVLRRPHRPLALSHCSLQRGI